MAACMLKEVPTTNCFLHVLRIIRRFIWTTASNAAMLQQRVSKHILLTVFLISLVHAVNHCLWHFSCKANSFSSSTCKSFHPNATSTAAVYGVEGWFHTVSFVRSVWYFANNDVLCITQEWSSIPLMKPLQKIRDQPFCHLYWYHLVLQPLQGQIHFAFLSRLWRWWTFHGIRDIETVDVDDDLSSWSSPSSISARTEV